MKFTPSSEPGTGCQYHTLIDIVFLLLIFFMVSTTFQKESELSVQLPQANSALAPQEIVPVDIVINAEGDYYIDGRELLDRERATLHAALSTVAEAGTDTPLVLRGDARAPHQAVVTVMDVAAELGLLKLSIATAEVQQ